SPDSTRSRARPTLARCAEPPDQPSNGKSSLTRSSTRRPVGPSLASTSRTSRITRSLRHNQVEFYIRRGAPRSPAAWGARGIISLERIPEAIDAGGSGRAPRDEVHASRFHAVTFGFGPLAVTAPSPNVSGAAFARAATSSRRRA